MPKLVLVEYLFDPPATEAEFDDMAAKLHPCIEARGVTWLGSFVGTTREKRICVFQAPDAETVRSAYHSAGVKFERAWSAEREGNP